MAEPMAAIESNRDLWQFITGTSLLRPKELIREEIERNKTKLLQTLLIYKKPSGIEGSALKAQRRVQSLQRDFVLKLSQFLALDEVQSYNLYRSYLMREYRGSKKGLRDVLSVERLSHSLVLAIRDYYFSERLYLLRSLKHLFNCFLDKQHPYYDEYNRFIQQMCQGDVLIKNLTSLYNDLCEEKAPSWKSHGNIMTDKQCGVWLQQNLKEQSELLEMMLLYYKNRHCDAEMILQLLTSFKEQSFGRRQYNRQLLDQPSESQTIGFLQALLITAAIDVETLQELAIDGHQNVHPLLSSPHFKAIEALVLSLGDSEMHSPLLLSWATLTHLSADADASRTKKLGARALQLGVFTTIQRHLTRPPLCGDSMTSHLCHSIVYGILDTVLSQFHEETLGNTATLYSLAGVVLKKPFLAECFWEAMEDPEPLGVVSLLSHAKAVFPFTAAPLLQIYTALATASAFSANKVMCDLQLMTQFTQRIDSTVRIHSTSDKQIWRLGQDLQPYPHPGNIIVPRGTYGLLCTQKDYGSNVLQWDVTYDGWNVLLGEINRLLQQIEHGAGAVRVESVRRVMEVCSVLEAVLSAERDAAHQTVSQMADITSGLYQILNKFSVLSPPYLDLLTSCLNVLNQLALYEPLKVWHHLQQTGLMPYLTHSPTDLIQAASGSGLKTGLCGGILAGYEVTQGEYPLTVSLLKLMATLVQPLHKAGRVAEMMACVLYVSREIFPIFQKWRYNTPDVRPTVGQQCLEIFHKILNIHGDSDSTEKTEVSVRDVCVYCLLFSLSGRALLEIVGTGVDAVEADVGGVEGSGAPPQLIQMVRLAFSVLNRLLLLRPPSLPASPVERALSVQPASRDDRHIAATIAQYIYHRHDPRLPTLATLLLRRMARVFPMSILACLGSDADSIRDTYLSRLQASTEDIQLKVGILELLSTCVETQPGLLEMFINIQPADGAKGKGKVQMGCLETVLSLIKAEKQGTYHCPSELLCAAFEFLHALWEGQQEMAVSVLRKKDGFWNDVCLSLTRDLRLTTDKGVDQQVLAKEIETCAYIIRIVAMEIYVIQGSQVDAQLEAVVCDLLNSGRLEYWSEYLCGCLKAAGSASENVSSSRPDNQLAHNALKLLHAWRNLLLVIATTKVSSFMVKDSTRDKLLQHLLDAIQSQFSQHTTAVHVKLAAVTSTLYLTLLKQWLSATSDWRRTIEQLHRVLRQMCIESDMVISSVQMSITTAFTFILQHLRAQKLDGKSIEGVDSRCLEALVPDVCTVLRMSTSRMPAPVMPGPGAMATGPGAMATGGMVVDPVVQASGDETAATAKEGDILDLKLKLQVMAVCLVEELIAALDGVATWLPFLKQDSLLECLLASLQTWIQARQGLKYVQSVMMLLLTLSRYKEAAEALALCGLSQHLCLSLSQLYSTDQPTRLGANPAKAVAADGWTAVYCLSTRLYVTLLGTLTYSFLGDALDFVGVHQDRMKQSLQCVGVLLTEDALLEAEDTCCFLAQLARFKQQWKLHLPKVLNILMMGVCIVLQRCISLLIRPRLLQDMVEKLSGAESGSSRSQDRLLMTPVVRRLSQQTSTDDVDVTSDDVTSIQHSLLRITSYCLVAMRQFTPDLPDIILDSSLDVGEYEALLLIGFSTGSVEQDALPSFGTLLSCINMCMAMHAKIDSKMTCPVVTNLTMRGMPHKSVVMFVLENALVLLMSQAIRYLKQASLASRDKQLLKTELSAELNSFLLSAQRYVRRGTSSPGVATGSSASSLSSPKHSRQSFSSSAGEQAFFKLVDTFVRQVLR